MKKLLSFILVAIVCLGVLVGCADNGLTTAKDYLFNLYKDDAEITQSDYELVGQMKIGNKTFTIDWSVDVSEGVTVVPGDDGMVTIDVVDEAANDIPYVLTATIKAESGETVQVQFNRKVPKFKELTWAEFYAAEDGTPVVVKGVVTGIVESSKENDIFLQDEDGGYYVYKLNVKPSELGLKNGMTVQVRGERDTYNKIAQITSATVKIVDETIKTVEATDITDAVNAAEGFNDADLFKYGSMLVTIKGVTVLGQSPDDETYFRFQIGDKISYVRISSSTCIFGEKDQDAFEKLVADNKGQGADVTGFVAGYSNSVYLIPLTKDAFDNFKTIERTPAEQVAFEKDLLSISDSFSEAGSMELPTAGSIYSDSVTFTWAVSENTIGAVIEGGKLTISKLPAEETKLTLTVTIASGEVTDTATFEVTVSKLSTLIPENVEAPAKDTAYKLYLYQAKNKETLYFAGEMDGNYFGTTTNPELAVDVFLEETEGGYYFYFMDGQIKTYLVAYEYADGKFGTKLDIRPSNVWTYDAALKTLVTTIKVKNTATEDDETDTLDKTLYLGTYNNFRTFSASETYRISGDNAGAAGVSQFVGTLATLIDTTKISAADKIAAEKELLTLPESVKSEKTISLPVVGGKYGDVTIAWALTEAACATLEGNELKITVPAADTTVTVTATLTCGETTDTKVFNIAVSKYEMPAAGAEISIPTANEIGNILKGDSADKYFIIGTVTNIKDEKFGNMTIKDADGNTIYVYGTYDATGKNRFDAMETKPAVGDRVILYSIVSYYNDKPQLKNAWIVLIGEGDIPEIEEPTVEFPAADSLLTIPEINELGSELAHDTQSDDKYYVVGVIESIETGIYGNMVIKDANGNTLKVYGTWDATGDNRYGSMENPPVVGDTVKLYGVISNFNGPQLKNGWIVEVTPAAPEGGEGGEGGEGEGEGEETVTTIASLHESENGTYTVAGTVVAINAQSFLIADETGYILVYRGSSWTADVAIGDVLTLTGKTSDFNKTKQFKESVSYEKTGTVSVTYPTAKVLSAQDCTDYLSATKYVPTYVELTGTLSVSGNYYNIIVDGTTAQGSYTYVLSADKAALDALNGLKIKVTGYFVYVSGGKYISIVATSFEAASMSDAEKLAADKEALTLNTSSLANGGTLELPATGTAGSTITYAITTDESGVASIEGGVLTVTPGNAAATVVVTATLVNGTANDTKTFTIEVASQAATESNKTLEIVAASAGIDNKAEVTNVELGNSDLSVKFAKGSGSNAPKFYNDPSFRFYGSNTLTIAAKEGYAIKSIAFVTKSGEYVVVEGKLSVTGGEATVTIDGTNVSVTFAEGAQTVVITNTNTKQVRIVSFVITYEAVETEAEA